MAKRKNEKEKDKGFLSIPIDASTAEKILKEDAARLTKEDERILRQVINSQKQPPKQPSTAPKKKTKTQKKSSETISRAEIKKIVGDYIESKKEELRGPPGPKGDPGERGPPGPQGPKGDRGEPAKLSLKSLLGMIVILSLVIAIIALAVAVIYNPTVQLSPEFQEKIAQLSSKIKDLNSTILNLTQENQRLSSEVGNLNKTVLTLTKDNQDFKDNLKILKNQLDKIETQLNELEAKCSTGYEYDKLTEAIQQLQKELSGLKAFLNKIEKTSLEAVDAFVHSEALGWSAQEMAKKLQDNFWVECRIREVNNVQYLFVRLKCCECNPWYWVTYQGLKPIQQCPIVSDPTDP